MKNNNLLTIGNTYKMDGYDVTCVCINGNIARLQTHGMTSGIWPGYGDVSNYNILNKMFSKEWRHIISEFRLPTKEEAEDNELIMAALADADTKYRKFGAKFGGAWLGTGYGTDHALYTYGGSIIESSDDYSRVIAPFFNIDLSKVSLDGGEIVKNNDKANSKYVSETLTIREMKKW